MSAGAMSSVNQINDLGIRVVCIPAFGIGIPNLTGLFGPIGPARPAYWLGYVYFVALSAAIWHGNRWLLFKQREHLDWFERPLRKIIVLLAAIIFYTAPLTAVALLGWYHGAGFPAVDWAVIQDVTLMNVICVVFVTHVYETVFLIKARESDLLRVERLERARTQAELDALRHQIDPHFLFNSLNTLSYLIESEPPKARAFNETLARVYRYILRNRERALVLLGEEMEFVSDYFFLLELRFGSALRLCYEGASARERYLIPPISLQVLVENAVKHNAFSRSAPMDIVVRVAAGHVEIANERRPRPQVRESSRLGLHNLNERCKLTTSRGIEILSSADRFAVRLPLLPVAS